MTKIQAAEAATKDLERALQRYKSSAERLTEAEGVLLKNRAEYDAAVAEFDESEKARKRVRDASDEVEMAKATVGRVKREVKDAAAGLIAPTRMARDTVQEAVGSAREGYRASLEAALRPYFTDDRATERAAAQLLGATKGAKAFVGVCVSVPGASIEVLAQSILIECRSTLRRLALV